MKIRQKFEVPRDLRKKHIAPHKVIKGARIPVDDDWVDSEGEIEPGVSPDEKIVTVSIGLIFVKSRLTTSCIGFK
jgi:hypothetical protein